MKNKNFKIASLILLFSIVLILVGIKRDEFNDIKNKAVRICLECIGIG